MDRNIIREIIIKISNIKCGESILIDDLHKDYSDIDENEFLSIISKLATRYIIRIDGRYSMDCYALEKYNKIVGLEREGFEVLDAICNDKIWAMTEKFLKDNDYDNFSFFTAVSVAKKFVEREIESIIKNN